jgi:cytochrome P450
MTATQVLESLQASPRRVFRAADRLTRPYRTIGVYLMVRRDVLGGLMQLARTEGNRVALRLGPYRLLIVNAPADVHAVLVAKQRAFQKARGAIFLARVLGDGLLTAEGETWRRARRLVQPALQSDALRALGPQMVTLTERHVREWADGQELDVAEEMGALAFTIASDTLFGFRDDRLNEEVRESLRLAMAFATRRVRRAVRVPLWVPTPGHRTFGQACRRLTDAVSRIVADSAPDPTAPPNLLTILRNATGADRQRLSRQELEDQCLTLLLAGHETTANALSWTWHLLAQNQDARAKLDAELDAVLGHEAARVDQVPRLPYLRAVVQESLRLYPPVWVVARQSVASFPLGTDTYPAGTRTLMVPWVMHHNPVWFPDPEAFRPERWLDGSARNLPQDAYLPFGAGPRSCVGRPFALLELTLVVATIARRFHLNEVDAAAVVPEPMITLRPRDGIRVRLQIRPHPTEPNDPTRPAPALATDACPFGAANAPTPA